MVSLFSWLDHSDKERRRVLEALDRFKETETRDELGLSSIRDGFANLFFPGTSVLMTRARYFLFIPWLYLGLSGKRAQADFSRRFREAEVKLINALGDTEGVIGRLSKATLKRTASSIYWNGLGAWGIRTGPYADVGQAEYHESLSQPPSRATSPARDDDANPVEVGAVGFWHAHLPSPPTMFPAEAQLALTQREAEYLRDRIRMSNPHSLLAYMTEPDFALDDAVEYPWLLPQVGDLEPQLRSQLEHAQCFAEVMHGASLLYNLMLAEKVGGDLVDTYRDWLRQWSIELQARGPALEAWDSDAFWRTVSAIASVRDSTKSFVNRWIARRTWSTVERATDDAAARALVQNRELQLKGAARARLASARALERWSGESGVARLSYRWPTGARLAREIVEALHA